MCNDEKIIFELVNEIDNFFVNGGSHMNVEFKEKCTCKKISKTYNECQEGNNACGIPTEFFEEEDV